MLRIKFPIDRINDNRTALKANLSTLISAFAITLVFTSCDPITCRDCETFNFDLKDWSIMDDTIASELRFIDTDFKEYHFELISIDLSEPYRKCDISGASCHLTKRIRYSCDSLNLDFRILYDQYDAGLDDNPALNDCFYILEFVDVEKQEHIITIPIDILHDGAVEYALEELNTYELANRVYTQTSRMNIDSMMTYNTYNTTDIEYIEAKHLREVVFQIPNGIVGLTLENGKELILLSE